VDYEGVWREHRGAGAGFFDVFWERTTPVHFLSFQRVSYPSPRGALANIPMGVDADWGYPGIRVEKNGGLIIFLRAGAFGGNEMGSLFLCPSNIILLWLCVLAGY